MKNSFRSFSLGRRLVFATGGAALLAIVPPSARAACLPVPTGVTGWWPLGADTRDILNNIAGVVAGDAEFANGKVAQGMVFDGANDGVQFAPSASLNVGTAGGFTVELWMKPDAVDNLQPLIEWNKQGNAIGSFLWCSATGVGTLDGNVVDINGVEHPLNAPAGTIVAGVWQHVAMTYDKASGLAMLYRNGAAVLQHNWGQMTPQTSWHLYFGSRGSYRFKGMMDEVTLFNRALSPLEIQSIYDVGSAGKCVTNSPPIIFSQPASLTGFIGSKATFTVVAGVTLPLTYQWFFGGAPAIDGQGATLTVSNLAPGNAGNYYVVITNLFGAVTSIVATLTIVEQPSFDLQTDYSSQVNPGPVWSYGWQSAIGGTFTPLAHPFTINHDNGVPITAWALGAGSFPIVYHNGTTNTALAGQGQGTYPPGTTWFHPGFENTPYNFGVIRCTIPPDADGDYWLESEVLPHLDGSGSGDCDYHVAVSGAEIFAQFLPARKGTNFNTILSLGAGDTVDFLIGRGTDGLLFGSGLKLNARLSRTSPLSNSPPFIIAQPQSQTAIAGENVSFSLVIRGGTPLSYQWSQDGLVLNDATNATLNLSNVQSEDAGDYRVVVSNSSGAVTSAVATLTILGGVFDVAADYSSAVNPGPVWSYGWQSAIGGTFTPLTYPFTVNHDNGVPVTAWALGAGNYPIVYHNGTSNTAIAGQGTYPPGTTWFHPGFENTPYNFGVIRCTIPSNASGIYRLESSVLPHLNGTGVNGSRDCDYHVAANGVELFGQFLAPATGTDFSTNLSLVAGDTVDFLIGRGADGRLHGSGLKLDARLLLQTFPSNTAPLILQQPQSRSALAGENVSFSVVALGSGLSYQWTRNGVTLADATAATLNLTNVQAQNRGDYAVIVSNPAGLVTSEIAILSLAALALDLEAGYSSEANPGPIWSYGWQSAIGGTFTPLTYRFTVNHNNGVPVTAWALGTNNYPIVYHNGTANTAIAGQGTYPPGTTWFHPGFENTPYNFGVIRCTIPTNATGSYRLESSVLPHLDGNGSGDCDYHVAANGVELFGQFLLPQTGANFGATLALNAGDTVDFLIGRGADGLLFGSGLKLDARLSLLLSESNTPPAIIVQPQTRSVLAGSSVIFRVAVNGSLPLSYQWRRNGNLIDGATNATLSLSNVVTSQAGLYSVAVTNDAGSVISDDAMLTVLPSRTLSLMSPPAEQEGSVISVPLQLSSEGEVGGMSFNLDFDTAYIRLLEWEWAPLLAAAFSDLNTNTAGRIRATFALPATAIPAGDQPLATLRLLLRSVPNDLDTTLTLQVTDVAGPLGDPITLGNQTRDASVHITKRQFIGDNNANQRLDVGDATTILRLLSLLDTARAWDIPANDLNTNNLIDTGDAIRVLRAAAGIDPQPGGGGLAREAITTFNEKLVLTPATARGDVGATLNFEVRLQDLGTRLAGAAFTLDYPTNALRLINSQSFGTGSTVPANSLAVWNVAPAQNNFATQNGHLSFAVSSANQWSASNGVLAIISFQVQPGASSQYAWPLVLHACEMTPDGYANRGLQPYGSTFIGRSAVPARLQGAERTASGIFQFTISGDSGAAYTVQASSNLTQWTAVTNVILGPTGFHFIDADSASIPRRFYRALLIEP